MEVLLRPLFIIPSRTVTPPPPSPPHQSSHSQNSPFLPPLIPTLSKTLLSSSSRFLSPAPVRQAAQESQSSADVNADTREWFMQVFPEEELEKDDVLQIGGSMDKTLWFKFGLVRMATGMELQPSADSLS